MDKTTEKAISLLSQEKSIANIAKELGVSRWWVYTLLKEYAEKYPNSTYCNEEILFKKINLKKSEQIVKKNLTKITCKEKYSVVKNYVFDIRFKSVNHTLPEIFKRNNEVPILVDDFLKKINVKKQLKKQFIELIHALFFENIILFKEHIISFKKIKVVPLVELTIPFASSMSELFDDLQKEPQTAHILKKEGITSLEILQKKLKRRGVKSDLLIDTCDGTYEIKPRRTLDKETTSKIISLSENIAKNFLCGFHIEILFDAIKKNLELDIDIKEFKTILIDSGKFRHYKASLIVQHNCEKVVSNTEAVNHVIDNKPSSIDELLVKLHDVGRSFNKHKLTSSITYLKQSGVDIKTKKEKELDTVFLQTTKHERLREKTYYYK